MHLSVSRRSHRRITAINRDVRRMRQYIQMIEDRLATIEQRQEPPTLRAPWWALPEATAPSADERS